MFKNFMTMLTVLIMFSSCAGRKSLITQETLEGKEWELAQIKENKVGPGKAHIVFGKQQGHVNGKGGCNGFGGTYSARGSDISIKEIISTKMACDDLETENAFFRALENATRYEIKDGLLYLYRGNEQLAVLKARLL